MKRRDFLKYSAYSAAAVTLSEYGILQKSKAIEISKNNYNVLFIAVDDLNDWVGCMGGHPDTITPNIDNLAKKGVLFTNAHCSAPECGPSRASVLTGIKPSSSGIYINYQRFRESPVLKNIPTLPQHFMHNGYKAVGAGKIFHDSDHEAQSWDNYWPSMEKNGNRPEDPTPKEFPLNGFAKPVGGKPNQFDWGPVDAKPEDMGDFKVSNWVIDQLNKKHEKPFFLACGLFRPHQPWFVPRKYFDKFDAEKITLPDIDENDLDDIPEAGRKRARVGEHKRIIRYKQWRNAVHAYLASINFADECVGRVINALNNSTYKDNTIIILWSDHGWHLGEKLHWRKFSLWEEATHNPLIVIAPGVTKPNTRCAEPVSLLDIYPTLIDLCGLPSLSHLEGYSLVSQLKNVNTPREKPVLTTHRFKNHSLRDKRWRYTVYDDGSEELYDHNSDPLESNNLAKASEYGTIKKMLASFLPKTNHPDIKWEDIEKIDSYNIVLNSHRSVKPEPRNLNWWKLRHEKVLYENKKSDIDLVFIGDSIFQRWQTIGKSVWNEYYSDRNALNLGFSGDSTQHVLWRLENGEIDNINPKLAVIMIGTNNCRLGDSAKDIADGVVAICKQIRSKLPNTKILLLAIFSREEVSSKNRHTNTEASKIYSAIADERNIYYLDINSRLLESNGNLPESVMPDGIHPSEKGYKIIARSTEPMIKKLMKEQ